MYGFACFAAEVPMCFYMFLWVSHESCSDSPSPVEVHCRDQLCRYGCVKQKTVAWGSDWQSTEHPGSSCQTIIQFKCIQVGRCQFKVPFGNWLGNGLCCRAWTFNLTWVEGDHWETNLCLWSIFKKNMKKLLGQPWRPVRLDRQDGMGSWLQQGRRPQLRPCLRRFNVQPFLYKWFNLFEFQYAASFRRNLITAKVASIDDVGHYWWLCFSTWRYLKESLASDCELRKKWGGTILARRSELEGSILGQQGSRRKRQGLRLPFFRYERAQSIGIVMSPGGLVMFI